MDMDMSALLRAVGEATTAAPPADAPAGYLHRRAEICAEALETVAGGEHPADVLAVMEQALEEVARPAESGALMVWTPATVAV